MLRNNLVHNMIMLRINIHEAKTHLSRYLSRLRRGEVIVICRRNIPIAEIRALPGRAKPRRIGVARGEFTIPESFFDPLPEDFEKGFRGET